MGGLLGFHTDDLECEQILQYLRKCFKCFSVLIFLNLKGGGAHFSCALLKRHLLESKPAFSLLLTYNTNCTHMEANSQQKHISILTPLDDQSISLI